MPRKPKDDLADFQEWLIHCRNITDRAASVYASKVRKTLRTCSEELTTNALDACFTGVTSSVSSTTNPDGSETSYTPLPLSDAQKNLFYSAWTHFSAYIKGAHGLELPQPSPRASQIEYDIPSEVWECVGCLHKEYKIPLADLFTHYRCDMFTKRGRFNYEVKDKRHTSALIRVRAEHIEPILEWATDDGRNATSPLFPTLVGSDECIPVRKLHKLRREWLRGR